MFKSLKRISYVSYPFASTLYASTSCASFTLNAPSEQYFSVFATLVHVEHDLLSLSLSLFAPLAAGGTRSGTPSP